MTRRQLTFLLTTFSLLLPAVAHAEPPEAAPPHTAQVERGAYLVGIMGCNDCHTPWRLGPNGPEPDMSRSLNGHPAEVSMPVPAAPAAPWEWMVGRTSTAFAGPWGLSFAANLTPDPETGLGEWNAEMFIATVRTRRHQGTGRPILPPMPVQMLAAATEDDLRAIFAYLQSLPPARNRVPAPVDPPEPTDH